MQISCFNRSPFLLFQIADWPFRLRRRVSSSLKKKISTNILFKVRFFRSYTISALHHFSLFRVIHIIHPVHLFFSPVSSGIPSCCEIFETRVHVYILWFMLNMRIFQLSYIYIFFVPSLFRELPSWRIFDGTRYKSKQFTRLWFIRSISDISRPLSFPSKGYSVIF